MSDRRVWSRVPDGLAMAAGSLILALWRFGHGHDFPVPGGGVPMAPLTAIAMLAVGGVRVGMPGRPGAVAMRRRRALHDEDPPVAREGA